MTRDQLCHALLLLFGLWGSPNRASAQQIARSQLGTVFQHVGSTRIEILYRRPVARGRALFGALVPWGRIWTPSADSAARMTISTLLFAFPIVDADSAVLHLRWGTTVIPLSIRGAPDGNR